MNGYFESSTQGMDKLLAFQRQSDIHEYKDQPEALKTLQDVITRWWSTYRSLRRGRWLKKAIGGLIASEQVDLEGLDRSEWLLLHQIEIVLETMAYWQRILEGEKYVTGSLAAVAIYKIREAYVETTESDAEPAVIDLTNILLKDFDERYSPAENGKVKYSREDLTGCRNHYIGLHQYFFFASFLDPRVLPMLCKTTMDGDDIVAEPIMTDDDFAMLKEDILDAMVEKQKVMNEKNKKTKPSDQDKAAASSTAQANPKKVQPKHTLKARRMLRGLNTKPKPATNDLADNELRNDCLAQLNRYLKEAKEGACPLLDENGEFGDPLGWWKANAYKYDIVALVARKHLPVPATSAPSERIWSRAAQILSLRRARLKELLVSRMMFVRENLRFLHQHYVELAKEERDEHLHNLVKYELAYLPPLPDEENVDKIDVGGEDPFPES